MTSTDNESAHSHRSHARHRHSRTRRTLAYLWSEWRLELVVGLIVAIAIFLLVEQMQIRETLASWLRSAVEGTTDFLGRAGESMVAVVRSTTLSDLVAYLLLFTAALLVTWRVRWRLVHTPRFTTPECPRCGGELYRVHRHTIDRLLHLFVPVRRYRCRDHACGWSGLRVHKRH